MITAAQARELKEYSDKSISALIEKADKVIREAAEKGQCSVALYGDFPWGSNPITTMVVATPKQKRIIERLKGFGYKAEVLAHGTTYVPRGLQTDDGDGPLHINHVIVVSW